MSDNNNRTTVQIGPSGLTVLTIVFVLLKVYGKIDWAWHWVLAPLWIPLALLGAFLIFMFVIMVLAAWAETK